MTRSILVTIIPVIILVLSGCSGDNNGNGNGPEPIYDPRLEANIHQDPGFQSVTSSVWNAIIPETLYVGTDNNYNANVLFRTDFIAELKALQTDTLLYIWARWGDGDEDNRFGALMGAWIDNSVKWNFASAYDSITYNEDRMYIMFDRGGTNGVDCSQMCHTTTSSAGKFFYGAAGDNADVWHWKAHRTGLATLADDMHLSDTMIVSDPQDDPFYDDLAILNWNDFLERPRYMHHDGPAFTGPGLLESETPLGAFTVFVNSDDWMTFIPGEAPVPKLLPGYYIYDNTGTDGSRWDVEALSEFDGSHWTVVFRRKITPGDLTNDINFNSYKGDSILISIGLTDNSGIRHHGTEPFYLIIE